MIRYLSLCTEFECGMWNIKFIYQGIANWREYRVKAQSLNLKLTGRLALVTASGSYRG